MTFNLTPKVVFCQLKCSEENITHRCLQCHAVSLSLTDKRIMFAIKGELLADKSYERFSINVQA